jgi:hypothetical protein
VQQRARRLIRRARAVARDLSHPRAVVDARREARALRREHPGLTGRVALAGRPRRRVLIVSLTDDDAQLRLEGILAKALEAHGGEVAVLTSRGNRNGIRTWRAFGVRRLVFYEDHAPEPARWRAAAREAAARCSTLADYKRLEYRGARVGRQALSTVVRSRHDPLVELADPGVRADLEQKIGFGMESAHAGEQILDAAAPDVLVTIERGYVGYGSVSDVALERGIPVIQFQASHRDDAFILKRYDAASRELQARSIDERTWERLLAGGWTEARERRLREELEAREQGKWFLARRVRHGERASSPDDVRRRLGLDPGRKVAVLFSHVLWDASMFYGRDLFEDQGKWFIETVRLAAEDDRVQWVVKLHPALLWKLHADGVRSEPAELTMIRDEVGELPAHVRLVLPHEEISNAELFRIIDAGITIRGTVGIELPPLGVPVITAGTSDYSGRGFTIDADTIEQYERNVRAIPELEPLSEEQVALAKLYAYGIFCVRPWRFHSFSLDYLPLDEAGDSLEHRVRFRVRSREELERAEDLGAFARWVLESDEADFVGDEELLGDGQATVVPGGRNSALK